MHKMHPRLSNYGDVIFLADLAELLGMSLSSAQRLLRDELRERIWRALPQPILPKIGGRHRWYKPTVEAWLVERSRPEQLRVRKVS